jgi:membrane protease YdiL (CAAX protease family)
MSEILNQFRSFSPFLKLLFLLMLVIAGMLISTMLGALIALPFYGTDSLQILFGKSDLSNPVHIAYLKFMQIFSHFGMFIIPAFLYATLLESGRKSFFLFNHRMSFLVVLIGGFVMVLLLPFVNYLAELNLSMTLPSGLQGLENLMRGIEESAEKMVIAFVSQTEWYALVVNLFMIAFIPAIGEELIFRGVLQRKLGQWFHNTHLAVFVSAFIFSAIHMQFFGFLPRFFLGIVLGYMFVWSGSLWMPMFAHFVNNALAVAIAWLHASGYIADDLDSFGNLNEAPSQLFLITLMAFAVLALLWFLNKKVNPAYGFFRNEIQMNRKNDFKTTG